MIKDFSAEFIFEKSEEVPCLACGEPFRKITIWKGSSKVRIQARLAVCGEINGEG